jgi:hypothetical protein
MVQYAWAALRKRLRLAIKGGTVIAAVIAEVFVNAK